MAKSPAAQSITRGILKLSRQLDASSTPGMVMVEPGEDCQPGRSFQNAAAIVRRQGGVVQYGWRLRELPSVYVEGEFHAVWRRPQGGLVDVTPRGDELTEILFLPDSKNVWNGDDVEPRRLMLHEQPCYCGSRMPFSLCHALAEDGA
jgi:hypothetical protein